MKKLLFLLLLLISLLSCQPKAQLPELGKVSAFSLTKENGQPFSSEELKGQVWIADFIFTTCPKECPLMTQEMAKIQDKIKTIAGIKLISFTVDPEHDTPDILTKYGQSFGAQSDKWRFLTGSRDDLYNLCQNDFHLPVLKVGEKDNHHDHHSKEATDSSPFLHSQKFVLVDGNLMIRGYYESSNPEELKKLEKDWQILIAS